MHFTGHPSNTSHSLTKHALGVCYTAGPQDTEVNALCEEGTVLTLCDLLIKLY